MAERYEPYFGPGMTVIIDPPVPGETRDRGYCTTDEEEHLHRCSVCWGVWGCTDETCEFADYLTTRDDPMCELSDAESHVL